MRRSAATTLLLLFGHPALRSAAAGACPPAFVKHDNKYIVSHADKGMTDPQFFSKPGIYGTNDPAAPKDASFGGAQLLCLGSELCKGFSYRPKQEPDDISNGVFFYGNDQMYKSSSSPSFVSYTLNPSFVNAPGCNHGGGNGTNTTHGGAADACGGGCIFLVVFFCGGFVYMAAGVTYNYKRMERRGAEAIPQVDFWKDLPFLVKDGVVFSFRKVREATARGDGNYTTV